MNITRILVRRLQNYGSPQSTGSQLRAKRIAPLLEMIKSVYSRHGEVKIVDLGGREEYWNIVPAQFLDDHRVEITIVNLPGAVQLKDHGRFVFVAADGCDLAGIGDGSFHIAHANSVVEHVGDWGRMVQFASEIRRVSQGRFFVQTPNHWFPIEPHYMTPFIHWLPTPVRVWLVRHFQLGNYPKAPTVAEAIRTVEDARLLDKSMFQELFQDACIVTEKYLGLSKSFVALRNG